MKPSFRILANLVIITCSLTSFNASAQSPRETLSKEAPNASVWALAALEQPVPPDIRQNIAYLREDLLDEGKSATKTGAASYKLASTLCDQLIATLDERNQTAVRAGYRDAQANANTKVTSRSLETMRNYKMSWPQYARERDERTEIQRQQGNNVALANASVRVEWAKRVAVLQRGLDNSYKQYREALREDENFQKSISRAKDSSTIPNTTPAISSGSEFVGTTWAFLRHDKVQLGTITLHADGTIASKRYGSAGWSKSGNDAIIFKYDLKNASDVGILFQFTDKSRAEMMGKWEGGTRRFMHRISK